VAYPQASVAVLEHAGHGPHAEEAGRIFQPPLVSPRPMHA
jgi:hypothetical protein